MTPFFGSSGTQKNRLPRAPVVACFSRFNPLILVSKLFRVFSKFKHSYPRLRGRGCIHRTSSTRRLSAAQGARTHSPTNFTSSNSFMVETSPQKHAPNSTRQSHCHAPTAPSVLAEEPSSFRQRHWLSTRRPLLPGEPRSPRGARARVRVCR